MKLISLNTWGGRLYKPLTAFLEMHRETTDIFCFQEVNDNPPEPLGNDAEAKKNLFSELKILLPMHVGYFAPQMPGIGMAVFVRENLPVVEATFRTVLATEEMTEKFIPRVLQHVAIAEPAVSIYNFHGVPKADKLDTPERQKQTARILEVLEKDKNPKILVGDFNLRPETESLRAFETSMRNLVTEGGFKTTRSRHYDHIKMQPFADYIFVSPQINVESFEVLKDEVSDHLALLLEFN